MAHVEGVEIALEDPVSMPADMESIDAAFSPLVPHAGAMRLWSRHIEIDCKGKWPCQSWCWRGQYRWYSWSVVVQIVEVGDEGSGPMSLTKPTPADVFLH